MDFSSSNPKKPNYFTISIVLIFLLPIIVLGNSLRIVIQKLVAGEPVTVSSLIPFSNSNANLIALGLNSSYFKVISTQEYDYKTNYELNEQTVVNLQFSTDSKNILTRFENEKLTNNSFTTEANLFSLDSKKFANENWKDFAFFDYKNQLRVIRYLTPKENLGPRIEYSKSGSDNFSTIIFPLVGKDTVEFMQMFSSPVISSNKQFVAFHFYNPADLLQKHVVKLIDLSNESFADFEADPFVELNFAADSQSLLIYNRLEKNATIYWITDRRTDQLEFDFPITFVTVSGNYLLSSGYVDNVTGRYFNPEQPNPNQVITYSEIKNFGEKQQIFVALQEEIKRVLPINPKLALVVNSRGVIYVLNLETQGVVETLTNPKFKGEENFFHFYFNSVELSPDKRNLVALDSNYKLTNWRLQLD